MILKRLFTVLAVVACSVAASVAQNAYTVLNLNSNKITYCDKPCTPGMKINNLRKISWTSADEAIVVRSADGRQTVVSPSLEKRRNGESVLVTNMRLSRRGDWDVKDLREILQDVRIFDEWHGYTSFATADPGRYVLTYKSADGEKDVVLQKPSNFEFVITRDMFGDDARGQIQGKIQRIDPNGDVDLVCEDVNIRFLTGVK